MSPLKVVSTAPKVSPQVFLLLGRAVSEIDKLTHELQTSEDLLAFYSALRGNLHSRRRAVELATAERATLHGA